MHAIYIISVEKESLKARPISLGYLGTRAEEFDGPISNGPLSGKDHKCKNVKVIILILFLIYYYVQQEFVTHTYLLIKSCTCYKDTGGRLLIISTIREHDRV